MSKLFATAVISALTQAISDVDFTSIGQFSLKNAAFPTVSSFDDAANNKFLLVSSFGALSSGAVYVVPKIKDAVVNNTVS
jgi:hypothetical protein